MELDKLKEIFMNPILILNFPKNEKTSFDSKIGTITFSNNAYASRIIIENDEKQWIFSYKKENSIIYRTRIIIKYKTSNRKTVYSFKYLFNKQESVLSFKHLYLNDKLHCENDFAFVDYNIPNIKRYYLYDHHYKSEIFLKIKDNVLNDIFDDSLEYNINELLAFECLMKFYNKTKNLSKVQNLLIIKKLEGKYETK